MFMLKNNKKLIIIFCSLIVFSYALAFSGSGAGTQEAPYLIASLAQLQEMKDDLTAFYKLTTNIDASATATWNSDGLGGYYGFEPIGTEATPFKAGFDGDYHVISNLYINRPATNDVGFIGYTDWESDYIKNIGLQDVDFTGGYRCGGLIGRADTPISNCFVTGSVAGAAGNSVVGGLAAQSHDPVTNCYTRVNVTSNSEVAGFISFNSDLVSYCYASGSVQQKTKDGGFIGYAIGHEDGSVENCFWDVETTGQEDKKEDHVLITGICYNPGGDQYQYIALYNPTASAVDLEGWDFNDGNGYVNIGSSTDIPANGFFLISVSGISPTADIITTLNMNTTSGTISLRDGSDTEIDAVTYTTDAYPVYKRYAIYGGSFIYSNDYEPRNTSTVCNIDMVGKTTTQMKTLSTFTDAEWDFEVETTNGSNDYWDIDNTETINNGYPFLSWENGAETALPITLSSFTATAVNGTVELAWETATETNNARFVIYRNGGAIGSIDGAGTTSEPHNYGYVDNAVVPGMTYTYILADVDLGNNETCYDDDAVTITIANDIVEADFVVGAAYPNPFNPTAVVPIELARDAMVKASLYDLNGREIKALVNAGFTAGAHDLRIDGTGLTTGMYLVQVVVDNVVDVQKIALMK